jgi:hypothetical protein
VGYWKPASVWGLGGKFRGEATQTSASVNPRGQNLSMGHWPFRKWKRTDKEQWPAKLIHTVCEKFHLRVTLGESQPLTWPGAEGPLPECRRKVMSSLSIHTLHSTHRHTDTQTHTHTHTHKTQKTPDIRHPIYTVQTPKKADSNVAYTIFKILLFLWYPLFHGTRP